VTIVAPTGCSGRKEDSYDRHNFGFVLRCRNHRRRTAAAREALTAGAADSIGRWAHLETNLMGRYAASFEFLGSTTNEQALPFLSFDGVIDPSRSAR
jgi:hypothetical protein